LRGAIIYHEPHKPHELFLRGFLLFVLLFFTCLYNANSLFEVEYRNNLVFSIEKDSEAVTHFKIKNNGNIEDEYTMSGASDAMIINFDFFEWNDNMYVLIVFDNGSLGTTTQIEIVDMFIFNITNNRFNLINEINLKNIVYDGKTKSYYSHKNLSYYLNRNENTIILFTETDGKIVIVETYSIGGR